jgi:SAM-dependent methyltransferase
VSSVNDLRELFEYLRSVDYHWEPLTPDELLKLRKTPEAFSPLHQVFGLGLPAQSAELELEGFPSGLLLVLEGSIGRLPAISRLSETFVAHDFWPPQPGRQKEYAHFGPESLHLGRFARERILRNGPAWKVLDLGCSSGGLALQWLEYQPQSTLLGIDLSEGAVELGSAAILAQGIPSNRLQLLARKIEGSRMIPEAEEADLVLFNPPMVHPEPGVDWPHRDGGHLGIELPLTFLKFASRHLKPGGQVLCLVTNPIVHGRGLFWDELKKQSGSWRILEKRLLNPFFNQAAARKRHHADDHIQQIELWALHLELS